MGEQSVKKIEEMLKKVTINTQFVEEEISIDIKYVQRETENSMIIDSGAPVSLVSNAWLKNYMAEAKVGDERIKQESNSRRFRLGKTLYISTKKVTFPIVMKTDDNDLLKRDVTANVIEGNEVNFLCGDETLKGWKTTLDFEEEKLGFKECKKTVQLARKSHLVVKLQLVGTWNEDEAVFLVQNEKDIQSLEAVREIHRKLNHKSKDQMLYAFRNANKLDTDTRKNIEKVLEECKICRKNKRSASKPAVAIPRATDFNSVVSLDLKSMAGKHILWMVCTFTKFIKGAVLKDKTPESVINALHQGWCMEVGFPTVGWWSDNGGEFRNSKMEEYVAKMGLTINFTPSYSPWSNGINKRNHYSCDVIVKKIQEENKKVTLQEVVSMAAWTHNTNGNMVTESLYDDETVRVIMERHNEILKDFRQVEFTKKLEKARATRAKGYEDITLEVGDLVLYQGGGKKSWLGPERIFAIKNKEIFLIANGSIKKVPRSNIQLLSRDEPESVDKGAAAKATAADNSVSFEIEDDKEARAEDADKSRNDSFGDDLDPNDIRDLETERRQTRSMTAAERREMTRDQTAAFWLQMENTECFNDIAVFAVEVPAKEHKRAEVLEAKDREIENLDRYEVFEEVDDIGQEMIGSRWVITKKERSDGQKCAYKGRLVARGFQEKNAPQADSPTMQRESLKLFFALAANQSFGLRSIRSFLF